MIAFPTGILPFMAELAQPLFMDPGIWERMGMGCFAFRADGEFIQLNETAKALLGLGPGKTSILETPFSTREGEPFPWLELVCASEPERNLELVRTAPETKWFLLQADPFRAGSGLDAGVFCLMQDITPYKQREEDLSRDRLLDPLTRLPNRWLFMDRVEHALVRSQRHQLPTSILFLDLHRFRLVNDSLGSERADQFLVAVAQRLCTCLRTEDTVSRLGGDQFAVLMEGVHTLEDSVRVVDRIIQALDIPFHIGDQELFAASSIGLAISMDGQEKAAELLGKAEVAMKRARVKGDSPYEVYDSSMQARALERLQMETELRWALERNEFELHYQPLIDLENASLCGFEALLRWKHPDKGLVAPLNFIPLAEETGLIQPIGQWVMEEACQQLRRWLDQYPQLSLTMNVNLSVRQFHQRDLTGKVSEALRLSGLEPDRLKLEITESIMMQETPFTKALLRQLQALRIPMVIDDFGTGYSSMSYLKRFAVDALKIDKSFVSGLGQDPEDTAIVLAIVNLAKSLGIRTTAEGIETPEQLRCLREMGCDEGQGYFFSKPLPAHEAEKHLVRVGPWT